MKEEIIIGYFVPSFTNYSSVKRILNYFLPEFKRKGFTINIQNKVAKKGKLIYYFLDPDMDEKHRGLIFDDILGHYNEGMLSRIRREKL